MPSCCSSQKTPFYLLSSIIIYISGILWLIFSLNATASELTTNSKNWPDGKDEGKLPMYLLMPITIIQILFGGISTIYINEINYNHHHLSRLPIAIGLSILAVLFAVNAKQIIMAIHSIIYLLATFISYIDFSKYCKEQEEKLNTIYNDYINNGHINV